MQTRSIVLIGSGILLATFLSGAAVFYFGLMVSPASAPDTVLGHIGALLLSCLKNMLVALPPTIILCSLMYLVSKKRVDLDPVTWGVASGVLVSLLAWLFYAVTNAQTTGLTADQVISNGLLALFFGGAGGFAGGKAAPES